MTKNKNIVNIIRSLLRNRLYLVATDGDEIRWRLLKNGLPKGSVLAPTLFNVYTNDQPEFKNIRIFIYADDLCLATQFTRFFKAALKQLTDY